MQLYIVVVLLMVVIGLLFGCWRCFKKRNQLCHQSELSQLNIQHYGSQDKSKNHLELVRHSLCELSVPFYYSCVIFLCLVTHFSRKHLYLNQVYLVLVYNHLWLQEIQVQPHSHLCEIQEAHNLQEVRPYNLLQLFNHHMPLPCLLLSKYLLIYQKINLRKLLLWYVRTYTLSHDDNLLCLQTCVVYTSFINTYLNTTIILSGHCPRAIMVVVVCKYMCH